MVRHTHRFIIPEGYKADTGTCCICGETKKFISAYELELRLMGHRVFFHPEDYPGRQAYSEITNPI
uniref:Uncharacterized protein n=1 Tax=viral metagenome TaxID=1070528 RepID=A0A6M3J4V5_9ZZZZ